MARTKDINKMNAKMCNCVIRISLTCARLQKSAETLFGKNVILRVTYAT